MKEMSYDGKKNAIHFQLRLMRKQRKVTQKDLAARMQVLGVNMDQQTISKIEHDNRIVTDYEFACFCKALRCTEKELLQGFYDKYIDSD